MLTTFPIRCPFILMVLLAKSLVRTVKEIKAAVGEFRKQKAVLTERNVFSTKDLQRMEFTEMLKLWGLDLEDLPRQILGHRMRIIAFSIILLIGGYQLWASLEALYPLMYLVSGLSLAAVSLTYITVSLWRISIYSNRRFTPLGAWLKGGGMNSA